MPSTSNQSEPAPLVTDELFLAHLSEPERAIFEDVRESLRVDYRPQTDVEKLIVDRIAIQHFRQYRLYHFEYVAESQSMDRPLAARSIIGHLDRFSRYHSRIERHIRLLHNRLNSLYVKRGDFTLTFWNARD
jgi:hypothetical protein